MRNGRGGLSYLAQTLPAPCLSLCTLDKGHEQQPSVPGKVTVMGVFWKGECINPDVWVPFGSAASRQAAAETPLQVSPDRAPSR